MQLFGQIGNTPLIKLDNVWTKLEYLNPSGSIKDRLASFIIDRAEKTGQLKPGYTIVEATSGNTGIAFSMLGRLKGYNVTIVMPKGMSTERVEMMKAYGARVILTQKDCVACAVKKTRAIAQKNKKTFLPRQFENPWNIEENQKKLGAEILQQLQKNNISKLDALVAGIGTGGTVLGVGKALQKEFPNIQLVAVEPRECPLLSENSYGRHQIHGFHKGFTCKEHGIEGIGDGFIPPIVEQHRGLIDEVITVTTKTARQTALQLANRGYLVGPSSGANFWAAKQAQKRFKNALTFFCDRGERYLSEKWMQQ